MKRLEEMESEESGEILEEVEGIGVGWLERMKNIQNHIEMGLDGVVVKGNKKMKDGIEI